jgi:hypothetical protein
MRQKIFMFYTAPRTKKVRIVPCVLFVVWGMNSKTGPVFIMGHGGKDPPQLAPLLRDRRDYYVSEEHTDSLFRME